MSSDPGPWRSATSADHKSNYGTTPPTYRRGGAAYNASDSQKSSYGLLSESPFNFTTLSASQDGVSGGGDDLWSTLRHNRTTNTTPFPEYVKVNFDEYVVVDRNLTDCEWNVTCYFGNGTNSTGGDLDLKLPRYWALFLLLFPLLTLFGNVLVVLAVYRERSLQTVTNYFIVSLAIADIMVALLVMPLAVYVEVMGFWNLGDVLCDAWVACDVMGCTASILHLTAISVDRFIAVTQPIKYARHKNSKRVHVMLALVWVVSIAISSPIALGMNYTERRKDTPEICVFYNSDFLIYSSMGSFYIPCLIMILLYWRIFRVIHERAKKAAMQKKTKFLDNSNLSKTVIENRAQTSKTSDSSDQGNNPGQELMPSANCSRNKSMNSSSKNPGETSFSSKCKVENDFKSTAEFTLVPTCTTTDTGEDDSHGAEVIKSPLSDDTDHVIPNDKSTEFMLSPVSEDSHVEYREDSGYSAPATVEVETRLMGTASPTSPTNKNLLSPPPKRMTLGFRNHLPKRKKDKRSPPGISLNGGDQSPRKHVTKFNFHLRHSKKKKEKLSTRRERKATKTLAIVLGCFLICWVPFFTVNIINAICIRYEHNLKGRPECNINEILFSFFVWLGYINSFLNPVIYTIFNIEFRRAFRKLVFEPCK